MASGLDILRGVMAAEDGPPTVHTLTGMVFTEAEPGRVVVRMPVVPEFANLGGTVHGGILSTLLDTVMGCSVLATLDDGEAHTTLELKVNFVRGVRLDGGDLDAVGTLLHRGRRVATSEGQIRDAAGRLVAHGTCTCLITAAD